MSLLQPEFRELRLHRFALIYLTGVTSVPTHFSEMRLMVPSAMAESMAAFSISLSLVSSLRRPARCRGRRPTNKAWAGNGVISEFRLGERGRKGRLLGKERVDASAARSRSCCSVVLYSRISTCRRVFLDEIEVGRRRLHADDLALEQRVACRWPIAAAAPLHPHSLNFSAETPSLPNSLSLATAKPDGSTA